MTSAELRKKFLEFFEKKGHKILPSSSLIPTDPSVLFTTAGMQQFKSYYLGEKSPYGKNVVTCQKCFRTSDIDNVGNERHLTFLEMLGNFSFGGYGKKEAIKLAKEFLDSINIKIDYVTVFSGDEAVPKDEESVKAWKRLGFLEKSGTLKFCGREDNFWGPTGEKGPCGPTTEIYSGGIEIWNIVFNQYYCHKDKSFEKLPILGVDTGMGLERLTKVSQNVFAVCETDLFSPLITNTESRAERIITDHIKAAVFLIAEGILPSNMERGYILRRILRRAIRYGRLLNHVKQFLIPLVKKVIEIYQDTYPELRAKENDILSAIKNEEEKFEETLDQGLKEFNDFVLRKESKDGKVGIARDQMILYGEEAFYFYQSFGFPKEIMQELCVEKGIKFDDNGFDKEFKKHQELSRTASAGMFKGGLADTGEIAIKYHTATHLLLAALRQILNSETFQKGSNITAERLRFDFNYPQKMTEAQIEQVENLVNQKIQEDIAVKMIEMSKGEALKIVKISFDSVKYSDIVKIYKIGDFSIELCGGPHVKRTSELGNFKIIKEESSSTGVRRIRAVLNQK